MHIQRKDIFGNTVSNVVFSERQRIYDTKAICTKDRYLDKKH